MKFVIFLILPLILFTYGLQNILEIDGAIACSLTHMNEYIMKSAEPRVCERVNYWVHYECGRVAGMYLTDPRCQPPVGFPVERLATSGSFMEISLDKSIYKMGDTILVSGNAYTSVGLPEKNLGIRIINSEGHKIFEGKNTVDKLGYFGFNILTGTSISINQEGNYELVLVDYGKFGSTGVKKFTVSNDGLPIAVPEITQPSPIPSQKNISSMIQNTSPDSPIILHTEKKEYAMGEDIELRGIVKFVDGKAVGVGLPKNLNVSIEVYDSKNYFIDVHVLKVKNDDTFILTLDTGTNSKISKNGQYYFVAYYGLVTNELLNSDYVGRYNVYVGASALPPSASNVDVSTLPIIVNTPTISPTNPPTEPFVTNWSMIAGLLIVGIVTIGIIYKKFIRSGSTNYSSTQEDPHDYSKESNDPMYPTYEDLKNNFARFSWKDAEDLTAKLFRAKGYSATVGVPTKDGGRKRNGDFGIDVRANNGIVDIGIQVKHQVENVDFPDVAKTLGVAQKFQKVIIVSTKSGFTPQALKHAQDNPELIELWDSSKFKEEVKRYLIEQDNSKFKEEPKTTTDFNYYEILGAERNDTPEEIKRKYKELSLKFHPDKAKSALSENNMKQVNEAYESLKDVEKRKRYDSELK